MGRRGYDTKSAVAILRRLFVESWAEPGFHNFWRVWNPVYGNGLFKLYRAIGGNESPVVATFAVFAFCGFVLHDTIHIARTGMLTLSTTLAFVLFALATLLSKRYERVLRQSTWPSFANVMVNLGLVAVGLWAGGVLDAALFGALARN